MIHILLVLAITGFAVWLILQIPMPAIFKNVIIGVIAIFLIIWALQMLGFDTGFRRLNL